MSENDLNESNESEETATVWGVVVDLDFAAVAGAETLYKVCESVFKDAGVPFNVGSFSRFILGAPMMSGITAMLAVAGQSKEKASPCIEPINRKFAEQIVSAGAFSLASAVAKKAVKLGGKVVAFSSLEADAAKALAASVGLPEETVIFHANRCGFGFYDSASIAAAAAAAEIVPRRAIALTGTSATSRAALMANMNVAALTSSMTEFQDFAGVDFVCDANSAKDADRIVDLVVSRMK